MTKSTTKTKHSLLTVRPDQLAQVDGGCGGGGGGGQSQAYYGRQNTYQQQPAQHYAQNFWNQVASWFRW
jgi:hypothetical protein